MQKYSIKNFDRLNGLKADRLFICGMGGSGLPGEIVNAFRDEFGIKIPIVIWKDYELPPHWTKDTLFVFISFSGTTAETISGLKAALKIKGSKMAILTGGGELEKIAIARKLPLVTFDQGGMMPRFALNPMFEGLVKILKLAKISKNELVIPSPKKTENTANILNFIDGGIPLIYTSNQLKSLAYIWKIWLNETAKTPAFIDQLPELDHNEIVGFESRSTPFRVIFIQDPSESEFIKKRIAFTGKLIKKLGGQTLTVKLNGKTKFERFWNGVYLGEAAATRLAVKKKRDPREIRSIDTLKAWMKK
jgi:glucose/mannose-6-phosphate isomerase